MPSILRSLSCGTLGNRRRRPTSYTTTAQPTAAAAAADKKNEVENFWDIDGYQAVIDRLNDGYDVCENLTDMINDRAKVEEDYVKSLRQWQKKWTEFLNTKSKEYGTVKIACQSMLQTAEKFAEYHTTLENKLIDKTKSPVTEIRNWLKVNYQKSHVHFKKRNEFDDAFVYAQKPWADYHKKLKKLEKDYHTAVKEAIDATQQADKAQVNPNKSEDQRRNSRKEADMLMDTQKKTQQKYEDFLKTAEQFKKNYLEDMKRVYEKIDEFEKSRMLFIKGVYTQVRTCFMESCYDQKIKEAIFKDFADKINQVDPVKDLKWWSDNYGAGMTPIWPTFVPYKSS